MKKINNQIYLDAASTTPPLDSVISKVSEIQSRCWGNSSSIHNIGIIAAEEQERCRNLICNLIGAKGNELVFTSGATESINLAIIGGTKHLQIGRAVISSVEHPAVEAAAAKLSEMGWTIEKWPVNQYGEIKLDEIERLLAPPTKFVSVIWAQSEVGTLQPLLEIGKICKERSIIIHTDATQLIPQGIINWDKLPIDYLTFSAHKLQGPVGVGILLRRTCNPLYNLQAGGGQENGFRSGTTPVALIAGMYEAMKILPKFDPYKEIVPPGSYTNVKKQRDNLLIELLKLPGVKYIGHPVNRLPHHISLLISTRNDNPIPGRYIVRALSEKLILSSSGTACSSGKMIDSAVLTAMGVPKELRQSSLRLTLGRWITYTDLIDVPRILSCVIDSFL